MGTAPTRHGRTTAIVATLRHAPIPLREAMRLLTALRRRMALPLHILLVVVALMAVAAVHMVVAVADPTVVVAIAE